MRILILGGGSGDVGRDVARTLLLDKKVIDQITVTSRKLEVSQRFVRDLGDERVSALQLDVTDRKRLFEVMKDHDLTINTVGPFSKYSIPIMKTAIESRVNYIDICDDIEPTLEALQLNKFAEDAGVFLLLSMGWFPGMSNLRAKALADQMDSVEEIIIAWVAGKKSPEEVPSKGLGGIEHYLKALTGEIYTFRNGHRVKIPAYQKGVKLPFPEPLGEYTCYQLEHPETATLPYVIPGVKTVTVLGSLYPEKRNKFVRLLTRLIDLRLVSIPMATKLIGMSMRSKKKVSLPRLNASFIACIGEKDGEKGQMSYGEVNTKTTTAEVTSQPLACAVFHIAHGGKIKPGVHLPETALTVENIVKMGKRYNLSFVTEAKEQMVWSEKTISIGW